MDTGVEIKKIFIVVREVLQNNYRSRNLIGPYHFWEITPRNSTFVHPTISHWEAPGREINTEYVLNKTVTRATIQNHFGLKRGEFPAESID